MTIVAIMAHVIGVGLGARFWSWLFSLPFRKPWGRVGASLAGAVLAFFFALVVTQWTGRTDILFWYAWAFVGWFVFDLVRAPGAQPRAKRPEAGGYDERQRPMSREERRAREALKE